MWISYSEDLVHWDEPPLAKAENNDWEFKNRRLNASGADRQRMAGALSRRGPRYGVSRRALLLDLENPEIIIARTRRFIMEPETYYEKFGYQIPNVVFPTGNVVRTGSSISIMA